MKLLLPHVLDQIFKVCRRAVVDLFTTRRNNKRPFYANLVSDNFFFFYGWEHRTGTMCPFSSLHPLRNFIKEKCNVKNKTIVKYLKRVIKIMPSGP